MSAFGALDLYSGSNSPTGTNLWQSDKNPLNELYEGVEDVIGKQAGGTAGGITGIAQAIINAILGIPLELVSGDFGAGLITDVEGYFGDLEGFLTSILDAFGLGDLINGGAGGLLGDLLNLPMTFLNELLSLFGLGSLSGSSAPDLAGGLFGLLGEGVTAVENELSVIVTNIEGLFGGLNLTTIITDIPTEIESFITNVLSPTGLLASASDLADLQGVVDGILGAIPGGELLQPLIDLLFNGLTNSNASEVPLGLLGGAIRDLQNGIETAGNLATQAFTVTQSFGGILHQLIEDLPIVPIYQGFEDFLNNMLGVLATTVNNIFQSLSPSNPGTAVNSNQIAALWAHVETTNTAGLHYSFNPAVALTANYAGTTNPAWAPAGPLIMPTVAPSTNYVWCTGGLKRGMVFTGNPNAATNGDHGLVTDKNQVYATLQNIGFGNTTVFMSGHYTSGNLGQNVCVKLGYGGPAAITLNVATGPDSGMSAQTLTLATGGTGPQYDLPTNPHAGDVLGLQYDGVSVYTIYYNNMAVATWTDTGAIVTHGPGYRETGVIVFDNGFNQPTFGLSDFTALDYV